MSVSRLQLTDVQILLPPAAETENYIPSGNSPTQEDAEEAKELLRERFFDIFTLSIQSGEFLPSYEIAEKLQAKNDYLKFSIREYLEHFLENASTKKEYSILRKAALVEEKLNPKSSLARVAEAVGYFGGKDFSQAKDITASLGKNWVIFYSHFYKVHQKKTRIASSIEKLSNLLKTN